MATHRVTLSFEIEVDGEVTASEAKGYVQKIGHLIEVSQHGFKHPLLGEVGFTSYGGGARTIIKKSD